MSFKHASFTSIFALWLVACASASTSPDETTDQVKALECGSAELQRAIAYCVSPIAAERAKQDDAVLAVMRKGPVGAEVFPLPIQNSPTLGPDTAAVTIVIFSDLECPYCSQTHAELDALQRAMPEDVRLVFKHFPLSFHSNARDAARAAQAAGEQGKFWEFVKLAYQRQDVLGLRQYEAIVEEIGADLNAWRKSYSDTKHTEHISRDTGLAEQLGVAGTPTVFFNGVALPPGVTADDLAPLVVQQRQIAEAFVAAGVPAEEVYWRMVRAQYQPLPEPEEEIPEVDEPTEYYYMPVGPAPVKGASADDALVTIVVFSDFECPFCARANGPLHQLVDANKDRVRLAYRHFPLPIHERADNAAGAAIIAHRQGKFWEMHDLLFANQADLSDQALQRYAEQLGLSGDINAAMREASVSDTIAADMTLGVEAGVSGTPTFFINGVKYVGVLEPEELQLLLDAQMKLGARVRDETGKKGAELYEAIVEANARGAE